MYGRRSMARVTELDRPYESPPEPMQPLTRTVGWASRTVLPSLFVEAVENRDRPSFG
jgi:hypothetical protein